MAQFGSTNAGGAGDKKPPSDNSGIAGYQEIPEEDRKKAKKFFDYAKQVSESGQFDYAITLFIQGLQLDPEAVDQHQFLRDISLKRKAAGGKAMGMLAQMKLPKAKEDRQAMLNAETLLAHDPGNTSHMVALMQAAHKAGHYDTVLWIGPVLLRGNLEGGKPNVNHFIVLKDIYKSIERYDLSYQASQLAVQLRPNDMDLEAETKNLSALDAMQKGKYQTATSFVQSARNMDKQKDLLEQDKDFRGVDVLTRKVQETEAEFNQDPNDASRLKKYIGALEATEDSQYENRAIEILDDAFGRTKQFWMRQKLGAIRLKQLGRMDRSLRDDLQKSPTDESLKQEYQQFVRQRAEQELEEFQLWVENYPTATNIRYDVGTRLFQLHRFDEAIPVFQQVRADPKYRVDAGVYLGRAFLESEFLEEAVETLRGVIEEHPQADDKAMNMRYWLGRALEKQGDTASALKEYSRVAQIDFNYKDVQQRIRKLRS